MIVTNSSKKLVDILLKEGKIRKDLVSSWQNLTNSELEKRLKSEGILTEQQIAQSYAKIYDLPYISFEDRSVEKEVLELIPRNLAEKYKIVAYDLEKNPTSSGDTTKTLKIAVFEPGKLTSNLKDVLDNLEQKKNIKIDLAISSPIYFNQLISQYPPSSEQAVPANTAPPEIKEVESKPKTPPPASLSQIDLEKIQIPYEVIAKFPEDIARKYKMVVFEAPHPSLIKVAIANPDDRKIREILDFIREKNDIAIQEFQASPHQIIRSMKFYQKPKPQPKPKPPPSLAEAPPPEKKAPKEEPVTEEKDKAPQPKSQPHKPLKEQPLQKGPRKFVLKPKATEEKKEEKKEEKEKVKEEVPEVKVQKAQEEEKTKQPQVLVVENNMDQFVGESVKSAEDLEAVAETGNVPKIVAASIILAVTRKASDIHIEPGDKNLRIRFRVDGILKDIIKLPISLQPAIISRIKILSKLKIDETRIPQDGRFDVVAIGHEIDLRISTLPTVHGEKIAMRILDKSAHIYSLEELGFEGRNLKVVIDNISKPYGVILSTGPTGSGKSTTLYAVLNRISNASVNIITLEDPVEYEVPGINQCQIKPKIGFTFANGLRSVLRQDPNIIMVGEIRDADTASLATHAALTGHLVLSTLHTNDAAGALPRITNMGVEPFLITSSINVIIAQRLVRRLCHKCVRPANIPEPIQREVEKELASFNLPTPYKFLEGKGCSECEQGYSGRVGIFEVLIMTDNIENTVITRKPSSEIKKEALKEGMITMKQDGLMKAIRGVTTVNEVLRVIST